jgi:uncharacterized protein DUF5320
MPGFDGTGPMGGGPATGGGRGNCTVGAVADVRFGRGFRRGFGRGGRFVAAPVLPGYADEIGRLKAEADLLRRSLDSVNARIARIEANASPQSETE